MTLDIEATLASALLALTKEELRREVAFWFTWPAILWIVIALWISASRADKSGIGSPVHQQDNPALTSKAKVSPPDSRMPN